MTLRTKDFLAAARTAARCCDDKKAGDIRLFDVSRLTSVANYYVVASADSSTQLQALQDSVADQLEENHGLRPLHREGRKGVNWSVLDFGGIVVHLLHRAAREFYGLERLWEGAKEVDWASAEKPEKPRRKTAKNPRKKTLAKSR